MLTAWSQLRAGRSHPGFLRPPAWAEVRCGGQRAGRKLEKAKYDLPRWRQEQERRGGKDWAEGFQILDLDDGAG